MNKEDKPGFTTETRWVTPEQAAKWLDTLNVGNRAISPGEVRRWADKFHLGRYQCTHQGIAFDPDGNLIDGQTRLAGLALSGVPGAWFQTTYNLPRSTFDVMDAGRARQAGQLIPGPHAAAKAASARLLLSFPRLAVPTRKVDIEEIIDSYMAHRDAIDSTAILANQVYRATGIQAATHGALLAIVTSSGGPAASLVAPWVEHLVTGAGLDAGDPRLALRNRWSVEGRALSTGGNGRFSGAYLLTRAWNAYATSQPMTRLQLPKGSAVSNSDIPEVVR